MRVGAILLLLPLLGNCVQSLDPTADAGSGGRSGSAGATAGKDDVLCDGSSQMRLIFAVGGGFVQDTFPFTNPHGHAFLAVDGGCHYYVSDSAMHGIQSDTLSATQEDTLGRELHFRDLARWSWDLQKDMACPDGSGVSLLRAGKRNGCTCGCDSAAPAGLSEALSAAQAWVTRLSAAGKPLDGAVSALAFESADGLTDPSAWPLARAVSEIPELLHTRHEPSLQADGTYARFDGADAQKLRELRSAAFKAANGSDRIMTVRDAGKLYELYVRDELPDSAATAWKALEATLP